MECDDFDAAPLQFTGKLLDHFAGLVDLIDDAGGAPDILAVAG